MKGPLTTPIVPARPANVAPHLHPWLRSLGFTVQVEEGEAITLLTAEWTTAQGCRFTLLYTHYHPAQGLHLAYASLDTSLPATGPQCLVSATHIRKTSEVRLLLLHNKLYKEARQAALDAGTLLPAHAQPA